MKIEIQSVIDLITNSSTETFTILSDNAESLIKDVVNSILLAAKSELTFSDLFVYKESIEELEKHLWIDIDDARRGTIQWIINNLNVIGCTGYCRIDPETKRIVELVGHSEWNKLPENERN